MSAEQAILGLNLILVGFACIYAYLYHRSSHVDFDINEGLEPTIDELPPMGELRADPSALEGKVASVGFNAVSADARNKSFDFAESYVIDTGGAIHTLETTLEAGKGVRVSIDRHEPREVIPRNAEVEQNARWLAAVLGVPFEKT